MVAVPESCIYLFIQTSPLDLYTDSFYENRRAVIEARLQQLHAASSETLAKLVADVWTTQEGKAAALVNWGRFISLQQIQVSNCCPAWALQLGLTFNDTLALLLTGCIEALNHGRWRVVGGKN